MNIDINIVIREYEQTIRDLNMRLANQAIEKATLQQKLDALMEPNQKDGTA